MSSPVADAGELGAAIEAVHQGRLAEVGPEALHAALASATVLVPIADPDAVVTVTDQGVCWVLAFTSPVARARYDEQCPQGSQLGRVASMTGRQLLDRVVPALPGPAGVAVNVGSNQPSLYPDPRVQVELAEAEGYAIPYLEPYRAGAGTGGAPNAG